MAIVKYCTALILLASTVALPSCNAPSVTANQNEVCITTTYIAKENVGICEAGAKIMFLPKTFGNEQLPILFAGTSCDHRFQIALSKGGVSCIFKPITTVKEGNQPITE